MIRKIPAAALALCLHVVATHAQGAGRIVTTVGAGDTALASIAVAAARSIEMRGSASTGFAGVFVESREVREATARVISATKLARSSRGASKVPFAIGRRGAPCRECDESRAAETWSFTMFRATPDSAYVGAEITSIDRGKRFTCIALARASSVWVVAATTPVKNAKSCGE